jgi:hypothetical protein
MAGGGGVAGAGGPRHAVRHSVKVRRSACGGVDWGLSGWEFVRGWVRESNLVVN